ncbi:hypothetical protein ACN27F_07615 [Solwaraspora sp. WMMB335]
MFRSLHRRRLPRLALAVAVLLGVSGSAAVAGGPHGPTTTVNLAAIRGVS